MHKISLKGIQHKGCIWGMKIRTKAQGILLWTFCKLILLLQIKKLSVILQKN